MKTLGNILWHFPFMGFMSAAFVCIIGLLLVLTVVAAPIGLGLLQLSNFLLWPFGRSMVSKSDMEIETNQLWEAYSVVVMILYFPIGLILSIIGILQIVGLFFSIIGIPVAIVIAKSLSTYLNPVNKKCVHSAVADEIERRRAQEIINNAGLK
ncbi:uncharacterized membrane protein YccF (DUF307 family) [Alteromonadaceae bacterium 2753L.S.0a.02]|nr:uncharacterized membrane protein YccF (DUF307 family) [Alteromonadaceae bacterium 2753L.S.0a.02]